MKNKIIFNLLLLAVLMFSLHSCIREETYASLDPTSKEYTNKSLWKEDEKYISNVRKVFDQYADKNYFFTNSGEIYWDYALTMGTFDESFLEVPVIKSGKINFILVVYREEDKIYFKRKDDRNSKEFFNILVFKDRSQLKGKVLEDSSSGGSSQNRGLGCYTVEVTWTWTNEDGSAGDIFVYNETRCKSTGPYLPCTSVDPNNNCGGSTGGSSGTGGGGGGYPYPNVEHQEFINQCAKVKALTTNAVFRDNVRDLSGKTGLKLETGYFQRVGGSYTYQDAATQTDDRNSLSLPNPDLPENKDIMAYMHTHVNDYTYLDANGDERIKTGIKMFSPADVWYFMDMLKNAQETGRPLSDIYGVMVTSAGNYQIRFTGNQYQIKSFTKKQIEDFTEIYKDIMFDSSDLESSFLNFLSEKMNVKAVNLYRMDSGGTNYEIKLQADKSKITTGCPS